MVKHIPQIKPLNTNQKLIFFVMKGKLVLRRYKVNVTDSISVLFLFLSIPIKLIAFCFLCDKLCLWSNNSWAFYGDGHDMQLMKRNLN